MGRPFPLSKFPLPMGDLDAHLMYGSFGHWSTRVLNPSGMSIVVSVFTGITSVTDRQTDRPTDRPRYSVGNNTPHLRM